MPLDKSKYPNKERITEAARKGVEEYDRLSKSNVSRKAKPAKSSKTAKSGAKPPTSPQKSKKAVTTTKKPKVSSKSVDQHPHGKPGSPEYMAWMRSRIGKGKKKKGGKK